MEPTFLFVGRNDTDVAVFRDAIADLGAAAIWEVPRALDLMREGELTGLVVADDICDDSAERLIMLARHVQPGLPIVYVGTPSPPLYAHARVVVERPLRAGALNDALGELAAPRSQTRIARPRSVADVLVVDHDRRFLRSTEDALRRDGYAAATTASAREARSLLQTTQFKLLILDVESGIDLARSIRDGALGTMNQDAPIVFLTDGSHSAAYEETFELDALRCVVKPVSAAAVCDVVAGLLHDAAA
jgi:CheY-like chemotaxis protein